MENAPAHTGIDGSAPDEQQHQADPVQQETPSPGMMPPPAMTLMPPEFVMPHTQLELGQSMVRAAYPYPDPYFGGIVAAYGPQAVIHPHMLGVPHAGVPLPSDAIEEPVYVNAKQYNGILRRRQSRAKAESENKLIKNRKIQKISGDVWKKKYQPGDLLQTSIADPAVQGLEVMLEVQKSQSKINQAFKCIVFITRRISIALQQLEGPTYIGGDGSQIIMERFQ